MNNNISEFNKKVIELMQLILKKGFEVASINEVKLKKVCYKKYITEKKIDVSEFAMGDCWDDETWNNYYSDCINDTFLGYYWFEYCKNSEKYRLTMFVKDFDEYSGNIHVMPGMLQFWRFLEEKQDLEKIFSINEHECTKIYRNKTKRQRENYRCGGGINYQEGNWVPLNIGNTASNKCCWDINANNSLYDSIIYNFWEEYNLKKNVIEIQGLCVGKNASILYGNETQRLYAKCISDSVSSGRGTYILYKWKNEDSDKMIAFYRHVWLEKEQAYFVIFDGEENILSIKNNEKGPNYLIDGKWRINYLYEDKLNHNC